MQGFFDRTSLPMVETPDTLIPKCGACGLHSQCKSPKMKPSGKGKKKILIVAEAPGADEDSQGMQLVGESGRYLSRMLRSVGIDMREDCWLENAIRCRPPDNRTPKADEIGYCRPNVLRTIREKNPELILLLGGSAVDSVIGKDWTKEIGGIHRWAGWKIPHQPWNTWICPTFHPAYLGYEKSRVLEMMFLNHLKEASKLKGRPWKEVPNYESQIRIIYKEREAARWIRKIHDAGKSFAFDYETNMLKPFGDNSEIVCCSISNGKDTIAYPWVGKAIKATKEILKSDLPKIASNAKFEHEWTMEHLGVDIKNWDWCTMLSAHIIDNRPWISSIKFQAFVLLGLPDYSTRITPFLESKGGSYSTNRVKEADLGRLLLYCGMDSLTEWIVARLQKKAMGIT